MKYKIEIWQYHHITETYESDNIEDVLEWYREEWQPCYEMGACTFYVYKGDKELSWDEEYDLGFYH